MPHNKAHLITFDWKTGLILDPQCEVVWATIGSWWPSSSQGHGPSFKRTLHNATLAGGALPKEKKPGCKVVTWERVGVAD